MKPLFLFVLILVSPVMVQSQNWEPLLGFSSDPKNCEVTIRVISQGCTNVSDFRFYRSRDTLGIRRVRVDDCKTVPDTISLTFPLATMDCQGLRSVVLRNELRGKANQRLRLNLRAKPLITATPGLREP